MIPKPRYGSVGNDVNRGRHTTMLRYIKYQNKGQLEGVAGKWFLRIKHDQTIDLPALAEHMANHNGGYSEGQMLGILTDMVKCIKEMLFEGKSVKIDNLALFTIGVRCVGADTPEEATPANIREFTLNARGTGKLDHKNRADVKVKELDTYNV